MDWSAAVDGYCERLGPGLWAEPVNAVTNLAFVLAAVICWRLGQDLTGRVLCVLLAAIGVASGLFHTHAVAWTGAADSLSILLFALVYLFAAVRDYLGLRVVVAVPVTGLFLALLVAMAWGLGAAWPALGANAAYFALDLLIAGWGLALLPRDRRLGAGLLAGAAVLALSITSRMLDMPLCAGLPLGTHWLWHCLNGLVLGWLIEVRRAYVSRSTVKASG